MSYSPISFQEAYERGRQGHQWYLKCTGDQTLEHYNNVYSQFIKNKCYNQKLDSKQISDCNSISSTCERLNCEMGKYFNTIDLCTAQSEACFPTYGKTLPNYPYCSKYKI